MTMEKKSADKVKKLIKLVNKLKKHNEELIVELNEKNELIEQLRRRLPRQYQLESWHE